MTKFKSLYGIYQLLGCYAFNKTQLQKRNLIATYNKKNTKSNNKNARCTRIQHKRIILSPSWKVQITIFLQLQPQIKPTSLQVPWQQLHSHTFSTMDFFVITLKLPLFVNHMLSPKLNVFASFAIASIDILLFSLINLKNYDLKHISLL
jgi:hypothetical protein